MHLWGRALGLIFLIILGALPAAAHGEDLNTCFLLARKSDPQLLRAKALLDAAQKGRPVARASLLPHVAAKASVSLNRTKLKGFGPEIEDGFVSDSYSITLSQALINGPAWSQLDIVDHDIRAARAAAQAAQQDLIMRVVYGYFNLLKAHKDLEAALSEQDLLQEVYHRSKYLLETGTGDIVSLQEAGARLDSSRARVIESRNGVEIAQRELESIVHSKVGQIKDVSAQMRPVGPSPDDMETWVSTALKIQPLLIKARSELDSARKKIEKARRTHWPKVELFAGRDYIKGRFLPRVHSGQWLAGLKIELPIFLGGEIKARTRQAEALSLAASHQLNSTRDQIVLATETAFLNLKKSLSMVEATRAALESAHTALKATRAGLQAGTRNTVDLLEQISRLENARRQHAFSLYNHLIARFELKRASGTLNEQDVVSVNLLLERPLEPLDDRM